MRQIRPLAIALREWIEKVRCSYGDDRKTRQFMTISRNKAIAPLSASVPAVKRRQHQRAIYRQRRLALGIMTTLAMVAGIELGERPQASTRPASCTTTQRQPAQKSLPNSNDSDRLSSSREQCAAAVAVIPSPPPSPSTERSPANPPAQIDKEVKAKSNFQQATKLGAEAVALGRAKNAPIETWEKARSLWQQALDLLNQIPSDSTLAKEAAEKRNQYQDSLAEATYRLENAQSFFLEPIIKSSGLSAQTKITICHLYRRSCRRWRGDEIPDSAASLIKLPVAVALMHKVTAENIRLDTPILVTRGNYTEDASDIRSGERYTLQKLMTEMIARSSNIATNQLIDYLGWDYINQVMKERGFKATRVNFKLMGESTMPANPGRGRNQLTSDELTEMMMQIYHREHLGDEHLIQALNLQYDHELGFAGLENSDANWLGEKTGQNARVLGTTLAMNIAGESYIITVIDDGNYSEDKIRRCVSEIAEYIFRKGHL